MKVSYLAAALVLSLAFGLSATTAQAQHGGGHGGGGGHPGGGASHGGGHVYSGGGHSYSGGGSYHGGGHYYGSGNAVPRTGGGYLPHAGGVAGARHPVAGTGYGSHYYSHGGYYGYGHYHYPYYPYYGYGYYPYYYGSPYFYGSLYFGWPYSYSYYGVPYASGDYSPNYTTNHYYSTPPPGEDQGGGESAPPSEDYSGAPSGGPNTSEIDRNSGELRLEVRPEDTSVYVDDRFCGTAREARGLKLPPGRHSVELVRPGFATEHREIDVVTGQRADMSVEMQRRH
jgi:hypothetical protein